MASACLPFHPLEAVSSEEEKMPVRLGHPTHGVHAVGTERAQGLLGHCGF